MKKNIAIEILKSGLNTIGERINEFESIFEENMDVEC